MKAVDDLYGKDVVSVEPHAMENMPAEMRGLDQVRGKTDWWEKNFESTQLEGRRAVCSRGYVRGAGRCGRDRESFQETNADVRSGVYKVKDGKGRARTVSAARSKERVTRK